MTHLTRPNRRPVRRIGPLSTPFMRIPNARRALKALRSSWRSFAARHSQNGRALRASAFVGGVLFGLADLVWMGRCGVHGCFPQQALGLTPRVKQAESANTPVRPQAPEAQEAHPMESHGESRYLMGSPWSVTEVSS